MTNEAKKEKNWGDTARKVGLGVGILATTFLPPIMLGGCTPQKKREPVLPTSTPAIVSSTPTSSPNSSIEKGSLFDKLSSYQFTGEDGQAINLNALAERDKNKFKVVAFGFDGCSQYCVSINQALASISKLNGVGIYHVNVWTETDRDSPGSWRKTLIDAGINSTNHTMLFPENNERAIALQPLLGAIANSKDAKNHSPKILLFDPQGKLVASELVTNADEAGKVASWSTIIGNGLQK